MELTEPKCQLWGSLTDLATQPNKLELELISGFVSLTTLRKFIKADTSLELISKYKYLIVTQDKLIFQLTSVNITSFEHLSEKDIPQ